MSIEVTNIPQEFDRFSTQSQIIRETQGDHIPGYPSAADRWHIPADEWDAMADTGVITVPDGPWAINNHKGRQTPRAKKANIDPANPDDIGAAAKARWRAEYPLVTDKGLPVHPMGRLGVTTELWDSERQETYRLGMPTGIGREWYFGERKTAAIGLARLGLNGQVEYAVVREDRDGKLRCNFPGGYVEHAEDITTGGGREGDEESNLKAACEAVGIPWSEVITLPQKLWRMTPAVTGPCTLNAWLGEHFWMIDATGVSEMQGVALRTNEPDTIQSVEWAEPRAIIADKTFLGAHRRAVRAHLQIINPKGDVT
jgi:ADP-ribose pyrophosphatase YjhB (NUDIX family)